MERWEGATLVLDNERRLLWANRAFYDICDLEPSEPGGRPLPELFRAFPESSLLRDIDAACDVGVETEFERQLRPGTSRARWLNIVFGIVRDRDGAPAQYVTHFRDVTQRREREVELRRLSTAVRAASQGIAVVDAARVIRVANPAYGRLVTCTVPLVGQRWLDLFERWVAIDTLHDIEFAVESEGAWSGSMEIPAQGGDARVVHQAITRLSDGGWIIAAHDATTQTALHEATVRARDLAELAATTQANFVTLVSHELRTPLNAVIGFSQLLMRRAGPMLEERDQDLLRRIHEGGRGLLGIVENILSHARATTGGLDLALAPTDLVPLLDAVIEPHRASLHARVHLEVALPRRAVTFQVDRRRFMEVVDHLVRNAVTFTKQGTIEVRLVEGHGGSARILVRDTGPGIPADKLDRIFLAFEQADAGTSRRYGGTGLGLTLARSLCELMGCRVSVESIEGVGSTFAILLPATLRCSSTPDEPCNV